MSGDFWGNGNKPVSVSSDQAEAFVVDIVQRTGLLMDQKLDGRLIEQYKQFAQAQLVIEQLRTDVSRRDAEIASLKEHINRLQALLTQMASGTVAQPTLTAPPSWINTTGALPFGTFGPASDNHHNGALPTPAVAG